MPRPAGSNESISASAMAECRRCRLRRHQGDGVAGIMRAANGMIVPVAAGLTVGSSAARKSSTATTSFLPHVAGPPGRNLILCYSNYPSEPFKSGNPQRPQGILDPRKPTGPVEATTGKDPRSRAVAPDDQPIAVMFDFMNPLPTAGRCRPHRWEAGLYKSHRQKRRSTRGSPLHAVAMPSFTGLCKISLRAAGRTLNPWAKSQPA